jgi:hypothetical protein
MATSEFGKAFAAARKEMGPGKTFTFKGKKYSTDMASDKKSSSAPKKASLPKERPSTPSPLSGNPRAGNRSGVKVKPSDSKKPSGLKGRNAGRVSRSMDDTPTPKRSGNPRGGNRSGVKMK